ncbi:MAG: hypothetical protein ChlgKO_01370 [Chlamydiales bacterium]
MIRPVTFRSGESRSEDLERKWRVQQHNGRLIDAIFCDLATEWDICSKNLDAKLEERVFSWSQGFKVAGVVSGLAFATLIGRKPSKDLFLTKCILSTVRIGLFYLPIHFSVVFITKYREIFHNFRGVFLEKEGDAYKIKKPINFITWWQLSERLIEISFPFLFYNYKYWDPNALKQEKEKYKFAKEKHEEILRNTSPLFQRYDLIVGEIANIAADFSLRNNFDKFNEAIGNFINHSALFEQDRIFLRQHVWEIYQCMLREGDCKLPARLFQYYLSIYDSSIKVSDQIKMIKKTIEECVKEKKSKNATKLKLTDKKKTEWKSAKNSIKVTLDDNHFLALSLGDYDREEDLRKYELSENEIFLSLLRSKELVAEESIPDTYPQVLNRMTIDKKSNFIDAIPLLLNNENIDFIEYCFESLGMKFFRKYGDRIIEKSLTIAAEIGNIHLIKRFILEIDNRSKKIKDAIPLLTKIQLDELDEYLQELVDEEKDKFRFAKAHIAAAISGNTDAVNELRVKSGIATNKPDNFLVEELIWLIYENNIAFIKKMFDEPVTINNISMSGKTPLIHALDADVNTFNLIASKANLEARDIEGLSCLDHAICSGNTKYSTLLLNLYKLNGQKKKDQLVPNEYIKIGYYYALLNKETNGEIISEFRRIFESLQNEESATNTLVKAAMVGCFDAVIQVMEGHNNEINNYSKIIAKNYLMKKNQEIVGYILQKMRGRKGVYRNSNLIIAVETGKLTVVANDVEMSFSIRINDYKNAVGMSMKEGSYSIATYLLLNSSHTRHYSSSDKFETVTPYQKDLSCKKEIISAAIKNDFFRHAEFLMNFQSLDFEFYKHAMLTAAKEGKLFFFKRLKRIVLQDNSANSEGTFSFSRIKNFWKNKEVGVEFTDEKKNSKMSQLLDSCLKIAIKNGQREIVRELLVNCDEPNKDYIKIALKKGYYSIASLLAGKWKGIATIKEHSLRGMDDSHTIIKYLASFAKA